MIKRLIEEVTGNVKSSELGGKMVDGMIELEREEEQLFQVGRKLIQWIVETIPK